MIPVITKEKMKALDAHMIEEVRIPSALLMENAAFGLTSAVEAAFDTGTRIVVVCGTGNNGGDGFAAARQLAAKGCDVSIYIIGKLDALKGDAEANAQAASNIIEITNLTQAQQYLSKLEGCFVIDAIFGIGLARPVEGLFAADQIQIFSGKFGGCGPAQITSSKVPFREFIAPGAASRARQPNS